MKGLRILGVIVILAALLFAGWLAVIDWYWNFMASAGG